MSSFQFDKQHPLLMGAAPAGLNPIVLKALATPVISHLSAAFIEKMYETCDLLRYAFQTKNLLTFPVAGSGSAAMELSFLNFVEPGDVIAVCENGLYGERMSHVLRLFGATVLPITHAWGEAINPEKVEAVLKGNKVKMLCAVHGESSTGVISDMKPLGDLCRRYGCLFLVDVVATIIMHGVRVDDWNIDIAYSNTQKGIGSTPGLSPITISENALRCFKNRTTPIKSYVWDLNLIMQDWFNRADPLRTYHHTAPVSNVLGLHQALKLIKEKTLPKIEAQYHANCHHLGAKLEELPINMPIPAGIRLPSVNIVDFGSYELAKNISDSLWEKYSIQVSGDLKSHISSIVRIGALGTANDLGNINYFITCFKTVLKEHGIA